MNTIAVTAIREKLSDALNRVAFGHERFILQRRGKDVAALVSMKDLELLQELEDKQDLKDALKALKEAEEKGTITHEDLKKELGLG